ncbi:MAG: c-type cytochrome [Phenylobacterium sp.]|uniref:c-type cytochrome n=1 Tax=Phenylobacterium sp. TaxID=1871053 RepID=UPI00391BC0E1
MPDQTSGPPHEREASSSPPKGRFGLGVAAGAGGLLAAGAVVGLIVVYSGGYDVAASEEHSAIGRWALDTTFHNSVRNRARGLEPPQITPQMLQSGAGAYKAMCQHCHAGPGAEREPWAAGMRPRPPHLAEAAAQWEVKEIYWIAKHGVKMSGMPAFGATHDDRELWGLAAFVKQLPGMEAERYARAGGSAARHGHAEP